jgi:hypothetical protein
MRIFTILRNEECQEAYLVVKQIPLYVWPESLKDSFLARSIYICELHFKGKYLT